MTERVEKIRLTKVCEVCLWSDGSHNRHCPVFPLLTALAQAEREREELRAEVERLKEESAEKGRWSAHWHGEMLEREAALARVRAAQCTCGPCTAHRAALEGRG